MIPQPNPAVRYSHNCATSLQLYHKKKSWTEAQLSQCNNRFLGKSVLGFGVKNIVDYDTAFDSTGYTHDDFPPVLLVFARAQLHRKSVIVAGNHRNKVIVPPPDTETVEMRQVDKVTAFRQNPHGYPSSLFIRT